jgi:sterol desaturase/sphingolipid hydroxylase (fatty acid hydroxylase superfamily)
LDAPLAVASAYLAVIVGGFAAVALWETSWPARSPRAPLARRWPANVGLMAINHGALPLLLPVSNAGAAWLAAERGFGLFHAIDAPPALAFVATLVAMDAFRYAWHRLLHRVPALWRLHRVHHSDLDYDCTLALRFHPLEALASVLLLSGVVVALGAPIEAVVASDLSTIALGYVAHGNLRIAPAIDRVLRLAIVTPAMHATHHSVEADEAMSNFGAVLSVWDRWLGTSRAGARAGDAIAFGLADEREASRLGFGRLLALPFTFRRA